jgi:hypothetical protein
MFEIVPNEKHHESFTVNKSHIISLTDRKGKIYNMTVEEFLKLSNYQRTEKLRGYRVGVDYQHKETVVDPYWYGLWLGDGSSYDVKITNIDEEVINYLYEYAAELNMQVSIYDEDNEKTNSYAITNGATATKNSTNILRTFIQENNLIGNKHITKEFMVNSRDVRLKVLAGLIDSDGYKDSRKGRENTLYFSLSNKQLAEDTLRLIRSLGYRATMKPKNAKCNGKICPTYSISAYGDFSEVPTKIARKKWTSNKLRENPLTFGFKVKSKGIGDYYGFTIDSDDHLFLLGDYTVTHNTESIASFVGFLLDNYPMMRIGIFTPRIQQAEMNVGRTAIFFQMNEEKLNHKLIKCTKQKIELDNGSYVMAVSGSDQSNIEGLTFDIIILDEAQKITDYTWSERIAPMGGATNAKMIKIGTPKTRNHFYKSMEGKESAEWCTIRRDWTECPQLWALDRTMLPDPETGIIRPYSTYVLGMMPKSLKQEMFPKNPEIWSEGEMSVEDFKTQYLLEFIDGAGQFFRKEEYDKLVNGGIFDWLEGGKIGERYVAGIDFAGSEADGADFTHITVVRIAPNGQKQKVWSKEMQGTSYPEQMRFIASLFGGPNPRFKVSSIFADYTGCGRPVVQTLQEDYGLNQLQGITFNAADTFTRSGMNMKNIMFAQFKNEVVHDRFKYPEKEVFLSSAGSEMNYFYHKMVGEWSDLEMTVGLTVNKKINAPQGGHDDTCCADILANFAAMHGASRQMPRASSARVYNRG